MKRILLIVLAVALTLGFAYGAVAAAVKTQRNQKVRELKYETKDLQIQNANQRIKVLRDQIQSELNNGHTDKQKIEDQQKQIEDLNKDIDKLEAEKQARLKKKQEEANRIASIQETFTGTGTVSAATGKEAWLTAAGVPQSDWSHMDYIIGQESGWCHMKWQGTYGACPDSYVERFGVSNANVGYGLCQSTPAIKYSSMGADWQTNAVTQLKWCYNYALGYGSAAQAASFKKCMGSCYSSRTKSTVYKATPWF